MVKFTAMKDEDLQNIMRSDCTVYKQHKNLIAHYQKSSSKETIGYVPPWEYFHAL